ncbi:MAG: alpha-amylase family glycosyl hydrolase [Actinomycetota bacterium]|nr:alpha-amylase family glycosyl hydrolase [Actinomycetota bacterium]
MRGRVAKLQVVTWVGALVFGVGLGGATTTRSTAVRPPAGAELEALAKPPTYTAFASERIYFVLPDRYANGDPTNDRGGRTGSRTQTGYDPTDSGWYHGGDLRGLTGGCTDTRKGLARIKDIGFTAIWIAPVIAQKSVQGDSAAYHGYWGLDFTSVDPHLGSDEDFAAFADCAHRLGLKVYLDVVVNHTADAILLGGGGGFRSSDDVPYRDCKGRPYSAQRYAGGKRFPCVSARYQPREPVVLANRGAKKPAWLNQVTRYHNRGDIDFSSCSAACLEQGDFFGLDDIFTEQPLVVAGLAEVYGGWIRRYRIDGFRVDTAKHVDRAFFRAWTPRIRAVAEAAGVRDFEIFGEVFEADAVALSSFVRDRAVPNVIDFPLQDALVRYAGGSAGAKGIASRLADDDYFRRTNGVAPTPATFLGNHDIGRAALKIKEQGGGDGAELLQRTLLGHSLLYLLRGAPVVYYGDELGIVGRGGDKSARQDLFPTGVPEWRTEERVGSPPIGAGSSFDVVSHPVSSHLRALAALRNAHQALATGASFVRHAQQGVLAVSRIDRETRHEYLAVFNASEERARVTVQTATPSTTWTSLLGAAAPATGPKGRLALVVPPLTAVLLRADAELPRRGPARPALRADADPLTDLVRVAATTTTVDPVSVTFAVRRAGAKRWQRLAIDDGARYTAFLDPRRFKRGEPVQVVAVVRASDGSISSSPVIAVVVRK